MVLVRDTEGRPIRVQTVRYDLTPAQEWYLPGSIVAAPEVEYQLFV